MIGRYRSKFKQFDDNGNLLCYSCKEYKPLDCFDRNPGKWFRAEKDTRCKECKKKAYLRRKEKNRGSKDLNRLLYERFHGLKIGPIRKIQIVIQIYSIYMNFGINRKVYVLCLEYQWHITLIVVEFLLI